MIKYSLRTRLLDLGLITIDGKEDGDDIVFSHPTEEGEIVLRVTRERAEEIAIYGVGRKHNIHIEKKEVHMGYELRHNPAPTLLTLACPHCGASMTWISDDFILHSIPWCRKWREEQ